LLPGSRALGGEPRGELAALRWQDIEEAWLHIRQNMVAVGELVPSAPKTKAGRRDIPLAIEPQFGAALREHRKRQLADRLAAGSGWTDTGLILAGPHGELIPPCLNIRPEVMTASTQPGASSLITGLRGCRTPYPQ
jgi:integrase